MKITLFTSNQPRHISLIRSLAQISDEVFVVMECNTVFPGKVADFFRRSEVMQKYFERVIAAEREVFGELRFTPDSARVLAIKSGDLNLLEPEVLLPALKSDIYIVFGSSYIKGYLCDFLVEHKTYNIHMGTSPFYRGNSCNFWAMYDNNPDYVGATIHLLSKGLDSGPMLFHAFPEARAVDPFVIGMNAVKSAHNALIHYIQTGKLFKMEPVKQDKSVQIRYTKNIDFTDEVAFEYLNNLPSPEEVKRIMDKRDMSKFLNPYVVSKA